MNSFRSLFSSGLQKLLQTPVEALQLTQVRFRRVYPIIRGHPRPIPYYIQRPEPSKYNWQPIYPTDGQYTIMPLQIRKLGGRDPITGRVVVKTVGGGNKKYFRWIDYSRTVNDDGSVKEEKVYNIRYDPLRSTSLALVGGGGNVRWIMATEKMRVGDIIRTFNHIPKIPVRPREGDAHPIGALPVGTKVHNVQILPDNEKTICRYAGEYAELTRRIGKRNYLVGSRGKREFCIHESCMVTVGALSNPYHDDIDLMCPQRSRWLGKRPKSGAYHKKDGYCGRKAKPPRKVRDHFATAMAAQKGGQTLEVGDYGKTTEKQLYILDAF